MRKNYFNSTTTCLRNFSNCRLYVLLAIFILGATGELFAQNMVVGTDFNTAWPSNACNSTAGWPSTYMAGGAGTSQIYTHAAAGTGNRYWRFGVNYGANTGSQYNTNGTSGPDVNVSQNTTYTLNTNCTSNGAMYYNVGSTSYNYVFKTALASAAAGGTFTFFEVQGAVQTVSSVTQSPTSANVFPGQAVTVSANMSGSLNTGQAVYLRYTNNGFTTTTVVQMAGSGSGPYTANIPASINIPSASLAYYVFTSGNGGVTTPASGSGVYSDGSNADFFSINLNNNGGSNYSYSVASGWVTVASPTNWSTASSWTANAVPPTVSSMGSVTINGNIAEDQNASISSISFAASKGVTINSGVTLTTTGAITITNGNNITFGATGALTAGGNVTVNGSGTLDMTNGGTLTMSTYTLTNGGTFNNGAGTVSFSTGTLANNSASYNGGTGSVTFSGAGTINGTTAITTLYNLTINSGTLTLTTVPTINGTFTINNGNISANINYATNSTLLYNVGYGLYNEWGTSGNAIPYNVTINSGDVVDLSNNAANRTVRGTLTINGTAQWTSNTSNTLTVNGAIIIASTGTLTLSTNASSSLTVGGNFTNNGGTFTNNSKTVTLNGGAAQTIGGSASSAFYNLTIANTLGGVSLGHSITVSNVLNLSNGILTTTGYTLSVTNAAAGGVTGGATSSYVSGPLTWSLPATITSGSPFIFPLGTSGTTYLPLTINTLTGGSSAVFTATAVGSAPSGYDATLQSLSTSEYWTITKTGSFTNFTVSLARQAAIGSLNTIAQSTGGNYTNIGGTLSGNGVNNSNAVTTVGNFALAQLPGPVITSVTSNNSANNKGYTGSTITINGTNLQVTGASNVTFGGTAAVSISTNTSTQLVVVLGAGTSGILSVTNTAGQTGTLGGFTYLGYITQSAADYNTASTWLGGGLPPATADVTINNNPVTISGASNSVGTLTINSGAVLNINNASGSITATTVLNQGTFTFSAAGAATATDFTIASGATLSWTAAGTLNIATGGTIDNLGTYTGGSGFLSIGANGSLINNSPFTAGAGTVTFIGAGTIKGTLAVTLNNLTLNGALTVTTVPTIGGTLQLNSGSSVSAAPIYGASSTLLYNVSYSRSAEWNAAGIGTIGTTAGYPNNVTINTGTFDVYNGASGVARALAGQLTVNNGATMNFNAMNAAFTVGSNVIINGGATGGVINMNTMSGAVSIGGSLTINSGTVNGALNMNTMSTAIVVNGNVNNAGALVLSTTSGGDIKLTGNWQFTVGGTFTPNSRAVFFTGSGLQTITRSAAGTLNFDYIRNSNTSGGIQLASSPATSVNVNAPGGGNGLSWSGSTTNFDLNGNSIFLTVNESIGVAGADNITSSITPGYVTVNTGFASSVSGSGTLGFSSAVTVSLYGGMDFGSGLSTISGTLLINAGGYVTNNAPTYASGSLLQYYSATTPYVRGIEWATGSGAGYPYNVQISNNTTVDPGGTTRTGTTLSLANNLTIDAGSALYMDYSGHNMTVPLNINGGLTLNGNLSESGAVGGDINIKGNWTKSGGFTNNARSVGFIGTSLQTIGGTAGTTFGYLTISNAAGVTLAVAVNVANTLTLTSGIVTTTSGNSLTITNTAAGGVSGGSTSSYINGPLNWTLPASLSASASVYIFPVGDAVNNGGAYLPLSITTITTGGTGPVVQVQATNSGSGGSYNNNALASISGSEYWQISQVSGNYTSASVSLTRQAALGSLNAIGWNNSAANGTYAYEAGTVSGTSINNSNSVGAGYLVMAQELPAPVITSVTVGTALNGQGANTGYIGQTVTITGSNFSSNDNVTFNGTTPINIIITPPSTITAIVNIGTSITTGTAVVTDPATTLQGSAAFTNLGYISVASSDWNTNTTWLNGGGGATNFTGTSAIPAANSTVTIVNTVGVSAAVTNAPNVVTVTGAGNLSFSGGSLTVNTTLTNGGTVDMTSGGTLTMATGSTLTNNATFTGGTGTVSFSAAGTINGSAAANLNNLTINAGSVALTTPPNVSGTLLMNNTTSAVTGNPVYGTSSTLTYNASLTKGNEWSSVAATYPGYVIVQNNSLLQTGAYGATLNIGHDLTLGNATSSGSMDLQTAAHALAVGGNITISNGFGTSTLSLSTVSGGDVKLSGNWIRNTGGVLTTNNRAVFFTGGNAQTITGVTTFDYLMMAKTANNLTLNNNINVNVSIGLTNAGTGGLIITGANVVAMGTGATSTGASATSHIDGNESYAFTSGSLSFTYDIGDASVQAGVNVTYSSITTGGALTASTTDGDHPQIATSGIYAPHSVLRYHSLTNSGIVSGSYNATFYFATSDLGAGSNTSDFAVMEYTGSAWNSTTTGTLTANSSQATGLTTYSDFQIGDLAPQGSLTSAGSICAGSTGQLVWTATAGTGPFSVVYNDGVSNHTANGVVSGTPFNVSSGPASNTTYTLVSVTDNISDITTSGFTGGSATITVIPTTPSSVSILASPAGSICQGTSVSFIASPTYGGSSPTYNFEVNGTSVQNSASTVLTSNTINNNDIIKCLMTSNAVCPSPTISTSNSITETVNALPTVYNVTGGGNFCPGGGVAVGLSNSQSGVNYELKNGASDVVGPISGTGSSITFGSQTSGATYTVVATNATTGCVNNMNGSAVVTVNPQAATPGISTPSTTVCSGQPVTFTASGGTQYGFNVNGSPVGSPSTTNTFTTSSLNNNDQVTVTSYTPFTFDGNIIESAWGSPIATSTGGPYDNGGTFFGGGPSFGAGHEINALYALSDANNINFAIAGNVQNGNRIMLFIQSTTGGYNSGNFGRAGAPNGVNDFNSGSTFDFSPNYCLVIGTNSGQTDYFFDLYTLSGTAGSGGGPDVYLGDIATGPNAGAVLGANPSNGTQTEGFEMAIPKSLLNYTSGTVKVMAMYSSDGGFLSNQFLTHAGAGAASYGNGAINFTGNPGSFSIPALNMADDCSATSSAITMTIGSNLTPTISISASATTICTGTNVTFNANITNGGSSPAYQWTKNGGNVGTNSASYSDAGLNNNDVIQCNLTSNASCVTTTTASSNTITMTVNSSLTPTVTIAANPSGAVCAGTNVTFTPTPTFGGTAPTYQWQKNGSNVATGATYSSNSLANGDVITCSMTSNAGCASPATVGSTNSITMSVNPLPTAYNMTGGGSYCSGTSGVAIGLSNSQTGVNYQLYSVSTPVGGVVSGNTGSAITFGNQTTNGTDYNVVATNPSTTCSAAMSGTETIYTNLTPATPSIFASENPICSGTSVSISAINGSLFQFFVNGTSQGAESTTNNFSSSAFANNDQVTVTSYSSIVYDGNISEAIWGSPLATSTGGPSPGFGTGDELNAVYANGDGAHVNFAIAGDVSSGNRILLFIDSKAGGYNTANFDETNAPPGLAKFNQGTTFDAGFNPDYCLVIGVNGATDNYFDLFTLAANSALGTDAYLGGRTIHNFGVQAGGNPSAASQTQGFEISLPNGLLGYTAGNSMQIMGMVISESTGFLSNQFLTRANVSENNYGSGAIAFGSAAPNPVTVSGFALNNTCTATSTPITMSVSAQPASGTFSNETPSLGTYCAGTSLSATASAGSGSPAGSFTDVLQYTTNGGGSWTPYTSASSINTLPLTSLTPVEIETYRTSTVAGCNTSTPNTITWTINPLPTIYNVTGGACAPVSIGLSNSQSGSNYQYALYVTNGPDSILLSTLTGTGSTITYGDQVDAGIYNVIATNTTTSCAANMNGVATVDFCTSTWAGGVDDNWTNQDNWNPQAVPNNCYVNVIIPSGTTFAPNINGASDISVRDMSIASGVTLTLNGRNINVCGQWTGGSGNNAAVIGSGTVFINSGTTAQTISGNTQFNILQIANTDGGVSLSRSAIVSISTGLQLASGNLDVSIATLHLLSTAANNNSYIDDFTRGFTGTLTGSITADRYVPVTGRNQHFVSSPVSTPAFSQLGAFGPDGEFVVPSYNCDETVSAYGSPYGSVFQYVDGHMPPNECMLGNWEIRSAGNTQNGLGYSVYLSGNQTFSLTGLANTGSMSVGGLINSGYPTVNTLQLDPIQSGWNLVGNPYPSAMDLVLDRTGSGFGDQVQIWQTSGPFAGSWQPLLITGNAGDVVIPPFQGFMVRKSATGTGAYPFNQGERSRIANHSFFRTAADNSLQLTVDYNGVKDMTAVSFNPQGTVGYDPQFDANKPDGNPGRPTLYTYMDASEWYAINTLPLLTQTAAVPMGLRPEAKGAMTITASGIETFDPTTYIFLEDKLAGGAWQNLRNGAYTFTTNATDNQQRFVLHFTPPAVILTTDATCDAPGMINIEQPGSANWNYTVTDNNNITVATGVLNANAPVTASVSAGVYSLTLADNNGYTVVKTVQVGGTELPSATFSASATTAQVAQSITFTGGIDNAASYTWDFGDGATASGQQATHTYQAAGVYTVNLMVSGSSGCVSTTSQTITITTGVATGIANLADGKLSIWSYENTVFVDFSKTTNVDAEVQLYNVLGQILSDERFGKSTLYSKDLTNMEAAYIIVKVVNNDQITTKKVFIANVNK